MTRQPGSQRGLVDRQPEDLSAALLIGIGNDGRSDDGLGWAFLNAVEQRGNFHGPILYRYQLQIEDAELISRADRVVFIDACHDELHEGFAWRPCHAEGEIEFTSHSLTPETVVSLCQQLYPRTPRADLLLIQGHAWDLQIGLSPVATSNLDQAVSWFVNHLEPGLLSAES